MKILQIEIRNMSPDTYCVLVKTSTSVRRHRVRTAAPAVIWRASLVVTVLPATREKHVKVVSTLRTAYFPYDHLTTNVYYRTNASTRSFFFGVA